MKILNNELYFVTHFVNAVQMRNLASVNDGFFNLSRRPVGQSFFGY